MWFKNIRAYRLTSPFTLSPEQLGEQLAQRGFEPCAKSQALALGWVPPLGSEDGELVHAAAGRLLVKLKREEKILPSTVVREMLDEKVEEIEAGQGRKVYRKERLNLKDEIVQDCLPRAFSRSSAMYAYIDTRTNWVFVDAASATRAEELLNLLRECIGSFPVLLPQVNNAPVAVMTNWLLHRNLPQDFELGQECELREPGEEGGVVRCRGVDLLSEEVETHLHAGKQVARISLGWDERLQLVLAEDLCLRRLKFADELMKENEDIAEGDEAARLDADFALMTDAIGSLQARVLALFGGEAE
ncbi:MAG: recombination-associated protein RdgC [Halioglobus sp.]|nr:recombination-associated protein RdgC [Halioglobus sp.]MCB1708824.1 recombination-associated protein RdgC [Halioglobus sp.]MCP5121128.1 recombination-associated protein RdgC [Pseudomonadales bacterium]MCP5194570.1 recombination-associated protein RdgC [Pseudomonadales bacterium]